MNLKNWQLSKKIVLSQLAEQKMKNVQFTYDNGKGKVSERDVLVVSDANDFMTAIDLSEFNDTEKQYYKEEMQEIHRVFLENIKNLGLGSNWRRFKTTGISI